MVQNMVQVGLDVESYFLTPDMIDGAIFQTTGHALGDRTKIVFHVADRYLLPTSPDRLRRPGKTDFEMRDELVRYDTPGGRFVISYGDGAPHVRFESP